ncbi:hypothetical protein JYB87_16070 [Shewanella avicenniae]|uniref:Peptidoglycan-binding protein, CsiV n=1 Tax=Shewanella avicenniae TaxID=2814294 RepID=A0ABX7QQG2_9GAMM|nr:hypothetical protein [Shewanella avicenniae]QSX33220.1 hypothetical protein JYB87_16070 [Shewanella avicenniae]
MTVGAKGLIRTGLISIGLLAAQSGDPAQAVSLSIPPLMTAPEMLMQLNQQLILSKNAPRRLNAWCKNVLGDQQGIRVSQTNGAAPQPSAEIRQLLQVTYDTELSYLKLSYQCNRQVVAVYEHWYVPSLVPPELKDNLQQADLQLGAQLRQLGFYRQSLSNRPLWPETGALPIFVLQHQALWYRSDKTPFSAVTEHYTRQLLPLAQQGQHSPY